MRLFRLNTHIGPPRAQHCYSTAWSSDIRRGPSRARDHRALPASSRYYSQTSYGVRSYRVDVAHDLVQYTSCCSDGAGSAELWTPAYQGLLLAIDASSLVDEATPCSGRCVVSERRAALHWPRLASPHGALHCEWSYGLRLQYQEVSKSS